jgi:hypothetical protein
MMRSLSVDSIAVSAKPISPILSLRKIGSRWMLAGKNFIKPAAGSTKTSTVKGVSTTHKKVPSGAVAPLENAC